MKHSPNFEKFLKKPRNKNYKRVYIKKLDDYNMPVVSWKPSLIYVGLYGDGYLHGARLAPILCGDFETWAFAVGNGVREITDEFWKQYERDGRCAFDRDHRMHFQNDEDRFTIIGATRRCNWCGEWHERHIEKRVQIERREIWTLQAA